jgi:hypothetical protein
MPRALSMALAGSSEEEDEPGLRREGEEEISRGLVVCRAGCFKLAADGTTSS